VIARGGDIAEAVAEVTMPGYKEVPLYDVMHGANVNAAYRTLEWDDDE